MDRNIGTFSGIEELWTQYPQGGVEGDTAIVGGRKHYWNKHSRAWIVGDLSDVSPKDNAPDISPFNGVGKYLGAFSSIVELWVRCPHGGMEHDYADVAGQRLFWNKYQSRWDDGVYDISSAVKTGVVEGNLHVTNDLFVGGLLTPKRIVLPKETTDRLTKLIYDARLQAEQTAKEYTDRLARKERLLGGALIDGKIDKSEKTLIDIIEEKVRLAKEYARLQDEKIRAATIVYADGKVTTLEQAQLDLIEAQINLAKAKLEAYADGKIDETEAELIRRLEEKVREAEDKLRGLIGESEERTDEKIERVKSEINQRWQGAIDTQDAVIKAMEGSMGKAIQSSSIHAMQALFGNKAGQFVFVDGFDSLREVSPNFAYYDSTDTFDAPTAFLQHKTLGVTAIKSEMSHADYKTWQVFGSSFILSDDSSYKYLYAKVSRTSRTGEYIISNTPIEMESDPRFYHLWVGVIVDYPKRYFQRMYGFTQILPGQITATTFMSADGSFMIDTEKKMFVFRFRGDDGVDKLFAINRDGNGNIEMKGATVFMGDSAMTIEDAIRNGGAPNISLTLTPTGTWVNGEMKDVSFVAALRLGDRVISILDTEIYFRHKYVSKDFHAFTEYERSGSFVFTPNNEDAKMYDGIIVECKAVYEGRHYYASARMDNGVNGKDTQERIEKKIAELIDLSLVELDRVQAQYAVWKNCNPDGDDDYGEGEQASLLLKLMSNVPVSRTLNEVYQRYTTISIVPIYDLNEWLKKFDNAVSINGGAYVDGQSQDYTEIIKPKIEEFSTLNTFIEDLRQKKMDVAESLSEMAKGMDIEGGMASYLTDAIKRGRTEVKGGVVLTSVLGVGDGDTVNAYISGDGNRPAFAAGVKHFGKDNETQNVAIYHDGRARYGLLQLSPDGEVFAEKEGNKYLLFGGKVPTLEGILKGEGDNSVGTGRYIERTVTAYVGGGGNLSKPIDVRNTNADIKIHGSISGKYNIDRETSKSKGSRGTSVWLEVFLGRKKDPNYKVPVASFTLPTDVIAYKGVTLSVKAPAPDVYYLTAIMSGNSADGEVLCGVQFDGLISAYYPGVGKFSKFAEDGFAVSRGRGEFLLFGESGVCVGNETPFPGVLCHGRIGHVGHLAQCIGHGYFRDRLSNIKIVFDESSRRYRVPHIIGHVNYTPIVTMESPLIIPCVTEVHEDSFVVELYDIRSRQKTTGSFHFSCLGNNYTV